jgi:hypothetical protein
VQFSKPRYVQHDMTLDGVALKKGDKVMAMIVAANMDPAASACPEKLDLQRKPNRHIAFGTGIHFCLGHQLARIEGKQALRTLFDRWPGLELATAPDAIRWRKRPGLRALVELPVTVGFETRAARPSLQLAHNGAKATAGADPAPRRRGGDGSSPVQRWGHTARAVSLKKGRTE